ncbi:MAG: DUF885 domain-containing protein [Myxococcales bacterium]|nr:DUF885 domain-containing protein [Myxococcales bacterium]
MNLNIGSSLVFAALCFACSGSSPTHVPTQGIVASANPSQELSRLYEEHFEANLGLNPSEAQAIGDYRYNHLLENNLSDEHIAASKELNDTYLARAQAIAATGLGPADRLRREFFIDTLLRERRAEPIPLHLLPVNQFYSVPNDFAVQGSGAGVHPFTTEKDYRDFIAKTSSFSLWVDTAILRMNEGIDAGIVLPKVLIERTLPQLAAQFESGNVKASAFYGPLRSLPASLSADERQSLVTDYERAIAETVMPAYQRLHAFMSDKYLAAGKSEHGLGGIPGGEQWYAYLVSHHTTTDLGPQDIHDMGLAEVARILGEMDAIRESVGFSGELKEFFIHLTSDPKFFFADKEELMDAYQDIKVEIESSLPKFFDLTPKSVYEVRPVEAFREKNASGASYQPGTADGTRPGVFYINTYNLKAQPKWGVETLSLHEAAPGHHFQISLQQEMASAPKFQRFSDSTAFAEGWALYAESIGKELGLFVDPYQYFGRLSDEMLRAMRLVVDTGLHAKGWTRQQAIDYMVANSALAKSDIEAEVERYMAIPGQALSYKIGQLKITELRAKAEKTLGTEFDLREFHNQVLQSGSLPMSILESKINLWLLSKQPHNNTTE